MVYMIYDIWYMVYGIWYMVYGIWYMVYGIWYVVYDLDNQASRRKIVQRASQVCNICTHTSYIREIQSYMYVK